MSVKPKYINTGGRLLDLSVPVVMGIVNITPDSFYKGSRYINNDAVLAAVSKMLEEGAGIIDIGGYSTRPGAMEVTYEEEAGRVLPAIRIVSDNFPSAIISVDTFRAGIAKEAVTLCGAHIINDIYGLEGDTEMFDVVKELNVPYVLMHMQGSPRTMQKNPVYEDVVADVLKWFGERIFRLRSAGVRDIIIDPGFGFGKSAVHNFDMLERVGDFSVAGLPVMAGLSRKSMIWKSLDISPDDALNGTTVLNTVALLKGVDILRVHDVMEAVQVVKLISMLNNISAI